MTEISNTMDLPWTYSCIIIISSDFKKDCRLIRENTYQRDIMRVLMLGDNLTAYNDLPSILAKSLQAEVESITKEDARLFEFRNPSKELGKRTEEALLQRSWDYVVLQDQISRPVRFR
jgi:hypothetical protein